MVVDFPPGEAAEFAKACFRADTLFHVRFGEFPVLVGAPHHTPRGESKLYLENGGTRPGDENAGIFAWRLAHTLDAELIVHSQAHIDPNKIEDSEFTSFVKENARSLYLEIHGHSGRNSRFGVEVTCGRKRMSPEAEIFAQLLRERFDTNRELSGTWDELQFTGSGAETLKACRIKRIPAFHIEVHRTFRCSAWDDDLPLHGQRLVAAMAETAIEYMKECGKRVIRFKLDK